MSYKSDFLFAAIGTVFLLIALIALTGCGILGSNAQQFTANTTASYEFQPCGQNAFCPKVFYSSNKDQQNFKADVEVDESGKPKKFHVETTASTPNQSIISTAEAQKANAEAFNKSLDIVGPIVAGAIQGGLIGGGPGAGVGAVAGALRGAKPNVPAPVPGVIP